MRIVHKAGPPGPPPRPGLVWKPSTHRWIRPDHNDEIVDPWHSDVRNELSGMTNDQIDSILSDLSQWYKDNNISPGKGYALAEAPPGWSDIVDLTHVTRSEASYRDQLDVYRAGNFNLDASTESLQDDKRRIKEYLSDRGLAQFHGPSDVAVLKTANKAINEELKSRKLPTGAVISAHYAAFYEDEELAPIDPAEMTRVLDNIAKTGLIPRASDNETTQVYDKVFNRPPAVYSVPLGDWKEAFLFPPENPVSEEISKTVFILHGVETLSKSRVDDMEQVTTIGDQLAERGEVAKLSDHVSSWGLKTYTTKAAANPEAFGLTAPEVMTTAPIPPSNLVLGRDLVAQRPGITNGELTELLFKIAKERSVTNILKDSAVPEVSVYTPGWTARAYARLREEREDSAVPTAIKKAQPPRPGLVPQSGDWDNPGRWIRKPEMQQGEAPQPGAPKDEPPPVNLSPGAQAVVDKFGTHADLTSSLKDLEAVQQKLEALNQQKVPAPVKGGIKELLGHVERLKTQIAEGKGKGDNQPPGEPPKPGLEWDAKSYRWTRPETGREWTASGVPIPPSWTKVKTYRSPRSHIIASGTDQHGKGKYLYSSDFQEGQKAKKFDRLKKIDKVMPRIQRAAATKGQSDDSAAALYLISKTGFRVGGEGGMTAGKPTYGASTLRAGHVKIKGDTVSFDFVGKKGVNVKQVVKDPTLVRLLAPRLTGKAKDQPIFATNEKQVLGTLRDMGSKNFKVHDLRTWNGTKLAQNLVNEMPAPTTPAEDKRARLTVAAKVAEFLGNTPKVSLDSYIAPEVFAPWDAVTAEQGMTNKAKQAFDVLKDVYYSHEITNKSAFEPEDSPISKAVTLANAGLELWGTLILKAEIDAEAGTADGQIDMTDLPGVPPQKLDVGDKKAHDMLSQVNSILQNIVNDPATARQLDPEERARVTAVGNWLTQTPQRPERPQASLPRRDGFEQQVKMLAKAMDTNISVKAVIKGPRGVLVLKDAYSDYWDLPGGHVKDGETLQNALIREVKEETGLDLVKIRERGVQMLKLDRLRPVVIYDAVTSHDRPILSEEHTGYQWAQPDDLDELNLGVFRAFLINKSALVPSGDTVAAERPSHEAFKDTMDDGVTNSRFEAMRKEFPAMPDNQSDEMVLNTERDNPKPIATKLPPIQEADLINKAPCAVGHHEHANIVGCHPIAQHHRFSHQASGVEGSEFTAPDPQSEEEDTLTNISVSDVARANKVDPDNLLVALKRLFGNISEQVVERTAFTPEGHEKRFKTTQLTAGQVNVAHVLSADIKRRMNRRPGPVKIIQPANKQLLKRYPWMGVKKEGDGGGIVGAGDSTVSTQVYTPTAGIARTRQTDKIRIISRQKYTTLNKALGTAPQSYVISKGFADRLSELGANSIHCCVTAPEGVTVPSLVSGLSHLKKALTSQGSTWVITKEEYDNAGLVKAMRESDWLLMGRYDWTHGKAFHFTKQRSFYRAPMFAIPTQLDESETAAPSVNLVNKLLKATCPQKGVVVDPFVNSGVTLMAARDNNCRGIGLSTSDDIVRSVESRMAMMDALSSGKLKKAVGNPGDFDMHVINKDWTAKARNQRFIVAGYASPVIVDLEGHKISREALAKDLPRFMANGGQYANVNVMHSNVTVGRIIPEYTDSQGKVFTTNVDDRGLFVIAEVRTDEAAPQVCHQVIQDVLDGKLRSFSISGNAANPKFTCDDDRCFYSIDDLQLYEITLCEEGVNQDAKLEVINKSKGGVSKRLTYRGIPLIRKHRTDTDHLHAPDFEPDNTVEEKCDAPQAIEQEVTGQLTKFQNEGDINQGKPTEVQEIGLVKSRESSEADLLNYFTLFKSLFQSHHNTGGLDIVLFDAKTGEVLLPD